MVMQHWRRLSSDSLFLQDYRIPVGGQLLVMIVIAGRLSLWIYVIKPVS